MTRPTFSVVVPAYGTEAVVADVVESVLAQTREDWELLVVDDRSPDELHRRVEPYLTDPRVRLVRLPENKGVSGARNEGIARTTGELVCFLDSDDLVRPRFLELVAAQMTAHPGTGIVGVLPKVTGEDGGPSRLPGAEATPPADPDDTEAWLEHLLRHPFHFRGTTVPREVLEATGGFDESLWLGEDLELWIRVVLSGRPVGIVDEPAYVHRLAGASLTRQADKTLERSTAHLEALDRIRDLMDPTPARTEALAVARRIPLTLEAEGRFRQAVLDGDAAAARRHTRTLVALEPTVRSRLLWAASRLPAPLVRGVHAANRRRRGLAPL